MHLTGTAISERSPILPLPQPHRGKNTNIMRAVAFNFQEISRAQTYSERIRPPCQGESRLQIPHRQRCTVHTHRRRATDPIAIQVMNIVITSSPGRTASAAWTLGKQTPRLSMRSFVRLNGRCAASRPRQSMRARVVDASQPEISHHIAKKT